MYSRVWPDLLAAVPSATNEKEQEYILHFYSRRIPPSPGVLGLFLADPYFSTTQHCSHYGEEETLNLSAQERRTFNLFLPATAEILSYVWPEG